MQDSSTRHPKDTQSGSSTAAIGQLSPAELMQYEKLLLRWMRRGLLTPAIAGVLLCVLAVALFIAGDQYREHGAVLVTMLGVGGLLILGAAAVASWRPDGFATYLEMHSALVDAAADEASAGNSE